MRIALLCGVLSLLTLAACKTKKELPKIAGTDIVFGLKKGGCFGKCPIYEMTINASGRAEILPFRNMDITSSSYKQLDEATMLELHELFADSKFCSHPDTFPSQIADLPPVWITYNYGECEKTIYGKEGRPAKVMAIEEKLNSIAFSDGWRLLMETSNKSKKPLDDSIIQDEFILHAKKGYISDRWATKYAAYDLKVSTIAPNMNYYTVKFNLDKISGTEMAKLLKEDIGVISVEYNKKLKTRNE